MALGLFAGMALFLILFWLIIIAVFVLAIIFWIRMLIDSINRKYKSENDKIVWVLVIVLLGLLGAIIYYFVVKTKK
jgi:hypothetical protein